MIKWGILGCGDVTEIKSGPAFNKVANSKLVAVMRRDAAKAADYAARHRVDRWYSQADALINDPDINAIYVATPPSSHEEHTLAALRAGKAVYVEKPMSLNAASARRMQAMVQTSNTKLSVAHYRREQPLFKKIRQLLHDNLIGKIRYIDLEYAKAPLTDEELKIPKNAWRVDPAISGGGLFHDLAPHQLDLMYHFFGEPVKIWGAALNQGERYRAADLVSAGIVFEQDIFFTGLWCFNVDPAEEKDACTIVGSRGAIRFSVFGEPKIFMQVAGKKETLVFETLEHVQQPMIEKVVQYFSGEEENPCSADEGVRVMEIMDTITHTR